MALSEAYIVTHLEACQRQDAMQANVHQNEGAISIINSVMTQLAQAKHQFGELQSFGVDIADVERAKARVFKLDMVLETLQAEVGDDDYSA